MVKSGHMVLGSSPDSLGLAEVNPRGARSPAAPSLAGATVCGRVRTVVHTAVRVRVHYHEPGIVSLTG